jgi:hypothetical protein
MLKEARIFKFFPEKISNRDFKKFFLLKYCRFYLNDGIFILDVETLFIPKVVAVVRLT